MGSSPETKTRLAWWTMALLVTGWLVMVVAAVLWGLNKSSADILLGGGILPVLFAIILRVEVESLGKQSGNAPDGSEAVLRRFSLHVGILSGGGFVLLLQYLVRRIAGLAA